MHQTLENLRDTVPCLLLQITFLGHYIYLLCLTDYSLPVYTYLVLRETTAANLDSGQPHATPTPELLATLKRE